MVGLDGVLVPLQGAACLTKGGHAGVEFGPDALHVEVLGCMQQLVAPLVRKLDRVVDMLHAHLELAHVHSDVMHGASLERGNATSVLPTAWEGLRTRFFRVGLLAVVTGYAYGPFAGKNRPFIDGTPRITPLRA